VFNTRTIKQYTQTRGITANGTNITIKQQNKNREKCTLIDVAIPANRNVRKKKAENGVKYNSLTL